MKHGKCIEEDEKGNRFEGSYQNGIKHGNFVEKDKTGKTIATGRYENGKKITELRKTIARIYTVIKERELGIN